MPAVATDPYRHLLMPRTSNPGRHPAADTDSPQQRQPRRPQLQNDNCGKALRSLSSLKGSRGNVIRQSQQRQKITVGSRSLLLMFRLALLHLLIRLTHRHNVGL